MWNKIQRIYIGTNQVRPVYKWEPWANTVAYYKFVNDINDYSWNGYNLTWAWNYSDNMITSTSTLYYNWNTLLGQDYSGDFSFLVWADFSNTASNAQFMLVRDNSARPCCWISQTWGAFIYKGYSQSGYWWVTCPSSWEYSPSGIHHVALVRSGDTFYSYLDWVQNPDTVTMSGYIWAWNSNTEKWPKFGYSQNSLTTHAQVRMWETIIENRGWSSTEMLEYFKWTKKMYGL